MDHWTFSAVVTQKIVNQKSTDIGGLKNGFAISIVPEFIILDLMIRRRNLSNYAKNSNLTRQV